MPDWLIWLIFAVTLGVAELFTLTAALGMLGGAAAITGVSAALGLPLPLQLLVFTIAATVGVILVRPVALRQARRPQLQRFGVDALIGRPARVVREVSEVDGLVLIGGEEWSARTYDSNTLIPVGTIVDVLQITGSTAYVYPQEGQWRSPLL